MAFFKLQFIALRLGTLLLGPLEELTEATDTAEDRVSKSRTLGVGRGDLFGSPFGSLIRVAFAQNLKFAISSK